jgi:SAM-dependent methyltransferase
MAVYTTEIASEAISSDNPIHQRLIKAYYLSLQYVKGDVLEVGCGEGRGVALLLPKVTSFTGIDKIGELVAALQSKFPSASFRQMVIPPFGNLPDNHFDTVVSFQVIEHIKDDLHYLKEIHRVLKPGGYALLTTPNIKMSLSRNPWHIREYTADGLKSLASAVFRQVELKGVSGNEKVMTYYQDNKHSVQKLMKWDVLNLQYRLPAFLLKIPYELLNRLNRNKLQHNSEGLVADIHHTDYLLSDDADSSLDLFCIMKK